MPGIARGRDTELIDTEFHLRRMKMFWRWHDVVMDTEQFENISTKSLNIFIATN